MLSQNGDGNEEESLRRRTILAAPAALLLPLTAAANAAETPSEAIRLLSAKTIPGLGPPDIYYPPFFAGRWKVTRVVTSSDDAFWSGVKLPVQFMSEMRFVPYDAYGKDVSDSGNPNDVPAIADRDFNERAYQSSLAAAGAPVPAIRTLDWTPTNPNVLSLAYTDGSSKEVKVTKRSSDVQPDGSGVFGSEFRRITDVPASSSSVAGGIPSFYKSRLLTKWRRADSDGNTIEGIEIVYNEQGTLGEKDAADGKNGALSQLYGGDTKDLSNWRSTKTKLLMERMT